MMFTLGRRQTKYIYPSLLLLLLMLLYFLRASGGTAGETAEGTKDEPRAEQGTDEDQALGDGEEYPEEPETEWVASRHDEGDLLRAVEEFNRAIYPGNDGDSEMYHRMTDQEDRIRQLRSNWQTTKAVFHDEPLDSFGQVRDDERYTDARYAAERKRLDRRRIREASEYRRQRQGLENNMTGLNRGSENYDNYQRQLFDLDRRHIEQSRNYERDYMTLDATFSLRR